VLMTANTPSATVANLVFHRTYTNLWLPPAQLVGTLSASVTAGTAAASVGVTTGLSYALPKFSQLILVSGANVQQWGNTLGGASVYTQGISVSAAAAEGATTVTLSSFYPTYSYPVGSQIYVASSIFATSSVASQPLTLLAYGGNF
jgi:hypothetical protein